MKRARVACASAAMCLLLAGAMHGEALSGSWDTRIHVVPSPTSLSLESTLAVTYGIGDWTFSSKTVIRETGWFDQQLTAAGLLGAFTVGSTLDFSPGAPAFERWELYVGAVLAGVTADATFTLLPDDLRLRLSGTAMTGLVDLTATMTFGATGVGCDLDWVGVQLRAEASFCCAEIEAAVALTCDGFDKLCLAVRDLTIPMIAWVSLDAELCFQTAAKTLVVSPTFDFGSTACFKVYVSEPAGGLLFGDVTIDALGLECEVGTVRFLGLSWLGTGTKPAPLAGTPYWEVYQIWTNESECCGPLSFDVAVYFLEGGTQLFDLAAVKANLSVRLATRFTFRMGLELDLEQVPTFTKWTLGFLVTW